MYKDTIQKILSAKLSASLRIFILLLAASVVFAAYAPSLSGDFVWDDVSLILNDSFIHEIRSPMSYLERTFSSPSAGSSAYFRPLTVLTFAVDWKLWNGMPGGFHLTNILIHLANVFLIFFIARKRSASFEVSISCAVIFGLLPRLAEPVSWISGRTDLLASMFVLLAVIAYQKSFIKQNSPEPQMPLDINIPQQNRCDQNPSSQSSQKLSIRSVFLCLLSGILLFAGLLCKEVAAAGAAAIAAVEFQRVIRRETRWIYGIFRFLAPLSAVICFLVFRFKTAETFVTTHRGSSLWDMWSLEKIGLIFAAIGDYTLMSINFLNSGFQNGPSGMMHLSDLVFGLLAVLCFLIFIIKKGVKKIILSDQFPWIILALTAVAPVIQIIPLENYILTADRFLYLPLISVSILIAGLISELHLTIENNPDCSCQKKSPIALSMWNAVRAVKCFRHKKMCALFSVIILALICLAAAHSQSGIWQTERSLNTWGCLKAESALACLLLGQVLYNSGQPETAAELYERSRNIENSRKENALWKLYSSVEEGSYVLQADALASLGRHSEALALLQNAHQRGISLPPGSGQRAALLALRLGKTDETRQIIREMDARSEVNSNDSLSLEQIQKEVKLLSERSPGVLDQSPQALNEVQLHDAFRLAEIFGDTLAQSRISLEILMRPSVNKTEKTRHRMFIEENGLCSILQRGDTNYDYPEDRCTPLKMN